MAWESARLMVLATSETRYYSCTLVERLAKVGTDVIEEKAPALQN